MKGVYLDPMKDKVKYEDPTRYRARTKEAKTSKKRFHSMIDIYRVTNMGKVNTHREIKRGQTNTAE